MQTQTYVEGALEANHRWWSSGRGLCASRFPIKEGGTGGYEFPRVMWDEGGMDYNQIFLFPLILFAPSHLAAQSVRPLPHTDRIHRVKNKIAICRARDAEVAALRCPAVKFSRSTPEPTMMRICPMRPRSAFHTPLPDPAMIIGMRYERLLLAEPWPII